MKTWLYEIILDLLLLCLVEIDIQGYVINRLMDWQTDGPVDRLIDASSGPSISTLTILWSKMLISLVFDESVTNGSTDERTDRPGYRNARTHLIMVKDWKRENSLCSCEFCYHRYRRRRRSRCNCFYLMEREWIWTSELIENWICYHGLISRLRKAQF